LIIHDTIIKELIRK